jgi:hypothetical protein
VARAVVLLEAQDQVGGMAGLHQVLLIMVGQPELLGSVVLVLLTA